METDRNIITDLDFEPMGGIAKEDITTDFEPIALSQIPDTLKIPRDDINKAIGRGLILNVSPSLAYESSDELTKQLKSYNLEAIDKDTPKVNQFNNITKGLVLGYEKEKLMEEYAGYGARALSSGIDFAFDGPEGKRIAEIENRMQEISAEEQKFNTFQYITGMTGYSARQWGSLMFKVAQGAGWGSIGGLILGAPTGLGVAVTVPTGANVGGGMAMWQYSYNLEAGNAYYELKKLRDENGNPLEPELIAGAAKAIGTVNTIIELTSDYFILKLIPGGKRLLGTQEGVDVAKREVMDRLKETLSKPSLRKAVLSSIGKLTAISSVEGLEEFIQGISAGRIKEGAKLLSEGEFEPVSVTEDAKNSLQEALAAFVGTATTLGLGAGGIEMYNQIGAIKRAKLNQKLFSDMIENVNQSELAKTNPEIYQDAINRIASKNGIENVYIPLEVWNNYWTDKNIDPKVASSEVRGKEINDNLAIPTGQYMVKIAPSPEITSALIGDIKFKEDELSLNEANKAIEEIKTQTEQARTVETEIKPLTDAEIEAKQDEQLTQLFESDRKLSDNDIDKIIDKIIAGEDIGELVTKTPAEATKPDFEDLKNRELDEVKQHVDMSIMAANKGKIDIAKAEAEKAKANGKALKLADGEEIDRLVETDLGRLPETKTEIPQTQTIEQGKVESVKIDEKLQAKIDKANLEVKRAEAMQELYRIAADCLKGGV